MGKVKIKRGLKMNSKKHKRMGYEAQKKGLGAAVLRNPLIMVKINNEAGCKERLIIIDEYLAGWDKANAEASFILVGNVTSNTLAKFSLIVCDMGSTESEKILTLEGVGFELKTDSYSEDFAFKVYAFIYGERND